MALSWGLLVLTAFLGWGGALATLLFGDRDVDAGLRSVWGMAFAVVAGGIALLAGVATRGFLVGFVIAGGILAIARAWRQRRQFTVRDRFAYWNQRPGSAVLLFICAIAVALQYVGSLWNMRFNPNDDFIAYFPFAKQILQQGTLFDPFNLRRALSLGGQSFLHALVLAGIPGFRLHLFDQGICTVIAAMLIAGDRKSTRIALPALLSILVLLTLPDVRNNTYPVMSGVVLFYGLYRTLAWLDDHGRGVAANAVILALVAAAACTLRSNHFAITVPVLAVSYGFAAWKGGSKPIREAGWAALFSALFLLPWMLLSYRDTGTPLFPLMRGHYDAAFPMLQRPTNWQGQWSDLRKTFFGVRALLPLLPLYLAGAIAPDRTQRKVVHSSLIAGLFGWLLLVHTVVLDLPSFERYVFGFQVAAALIILARIGMPASDDDARLRLRTRVAVALVILGVGVQLAMSVRPAVTAQFVLADKIALLARVPIQDPVHSPLGERYRALQESIPPGERMLVMVDFPYLFDFRRNAIANIDTAAALSPPPGFPRFRGADAVADYLHGQRIRYWAFVKPEQAVALYRRDLWQKQLRDPYPVWRAQAPAYLDLFDSVTALAGAYRHVYEDESLVLLDLESKAR